MSDEQQEGHDGYLAIYIPGSATVAKMHALLGVAYAIICSGVAAQSDFPWSFPEAVTRSSSNIAKAQHGLSSETSDQRKIIDGLVKRGSANLEQAGSLISSDLAAAFFYHHSTGIG